MGSFIVLQENSSSLLNYLVIKYVSLQGGAKETHESDAATGDSTADSDIKPQLPLPEPSDINQASLVNFDEIELELKKIAASVQGVCVA